MAPWHCPQSIKLDHIALPSCTGAAPLPCRHKNHNHCKCKSRPHLHLDMTVNLAGPKLPRADHSHLPAISWWVGEALATDHVSIRNWQGPHADHSHLPSPRQHSNLTGSYLSSSTLAATHRTFPLAFLIPNTLYHGLTWRSGKALGRRWPLTI